MPAANEQNRDITLPPDTYLYLQNEGKGGIITVYKGPNVVNQTGQDSPVRYDPATRRYHPCTLEAGVQIAPRAAEGDYVIIENPTEDNKFPKETSNPFKELIKGRKIVIPGPWSEALYPGQSATVIEGHRLRSNQFLVAIIYNDKEAEQNWEKGTVAKVQAEHKEGEQQTVQPKAKGLPKPDSFAVGTRVVIRGSDVSFYIPCTGVEVMKDEETGKYVREAVTLEQLEYCCLIDESGKKVYPQGPDVVFPLPTQVFDKDSRGRRKFRPIELNTINGIHLKVTANFEGPDIENDTSKEREFREGEELFVTGKALSIYYPREELAIIEYGPGNKKHYSTAIPKGEGRYVINRGSGDIRVEKGPRMYLADPRTEIPVRRVLSQEECELWYPGNKEAVTYNLDLAAAVAESPSGRSGNMISEGDYRKRQAKQRGGHEAASYLMAAGPIASADAFTDEDAFTPESVGDVGHGTESIRRGTKFTPPRTITLNTKYDGVPKIEIWPGYAILVVGAEGSRRVEVGPSVVLLKYDEKLGFMELSTGKPKTTDKLMRTAYLCVQNNQVGDIVPFESADHVKGTVKISLRVSFDAETEEDRLKWFGVDNYVKYLTDHVRSLIAGMAKRHPVSAIKGDYVNLVRDAILGAKTDGKRNGLVFPDNLMRVVEVEVLDLGLSDTSISQLLDKAQLDVVRSNIQIDQARRDLETTQQLEEIAQKKLQAAHDTQEKKLYLQQQTILQNLQVTIITLESELKTLVERVKTNEAQEKLNDLVAQAKLARDKAETEQGIELSRAEQAVELQKLEAETKAAVEKFKAAQAGLCETLVALGRDDMAVRFAEAINIERHLTGDSLGSSVGNLLSFVPTLQQFWDRAQKAQDAKSNGNRLAQATS